MNQKTKISLREKNHVNLGIGSCRLGQCKDYLGTYLTSYKDTEIHRYRDTYRGIQVHVRNMYTFVKIGTSYVVHTTSTAVR